MKTRNPKRNAAGTIDVEIEHPVYGWIPFTASPDDPEPHGRELFAQAMAGDLGPVADYVAPLPDVAAIRRGEILARLQAIDTESIRALRTTVSATAKGKPAPAFDLGKLEALETEAAALRAELATLGAA